MRIFAALLTLFLLPLLLSSVSADTEARIVQVDGSLRVIHPDASITENAGISQEIPLGSTLVAAEGCKARIELPGLGVLTLTGPATARLESIDGRPAVVLVAGVANFEYGSGMVILQVESGRLGFEGVCGYAGDLVDGTSILISGDSGSARVRVRGGSTLLARGSEYVRLGWGELISLKSTGAAVEETGGASEPQISLRSRTIEIILPPETAKSGANSDSPLVRDMVETWQQDRESPRIP